MDRILASIPKVAVESVPDIAEDVTAEQLLDRASERPVVRLVDHIVAQGIAARASDIHLEAQEESVVVRLRVDGVLRHAMSLPRAIGLPLVSRVKIMSGMDIADRLRPQGGRAMVKIDGERIDLRVSTLPSAHGEKVVIRILDSRGAVKSLDALGFATDDLDRLKRLLETREGLILVTGPTGSGKTTTLYAALHQMLERGLNVITVEDPVEYRIAGIVQSQVNEKAGLTFAAALRSILRQDPDVILVGEIRDQETASIAIQASLTGHLVFATLHTIDAASSIARLHDLGVEPAKVAAALKGVVAQRLLRRTCNACAAPTCAPIPSSLWGVVPSGARLWSGKGCALCAGTGFQGRLAVVELLSMTASISKLIAAARPAATIATAARAEGMRSLWSGGVARVLDGDTTPDEVSRVLDSETDDQSASDPRDLELGEYLSPARSDGARAVAETYSSRDGATLIDMDDGSEGVTQSGTRMRVGVVDVYVIDPSREPWRVLTLRRSTSTRCPGAWEAIHGHIEADERPEDAALRELREETGLDAQRLYNVTVHAFYLHSISTVELAVVFCAFADSLNRVTLGSEHDAYEWLPIDEAPARLIWPRATQALGEIRKLLASGDAGAAEDVLRVR